VSAILAPGAGAPISPGETRDEGGAADLRFNPRLSSGHSRPTMGGSGCRPKAEEGAQGRPPKTRAAIRTVGLIVPGAIAEGLGISFAKARTGRFVANAPLRLAGVYGRAPRPNEFPAPPQPLRTPTTGRKGPSRQNGPRCPNPRLEVRSLHGRRPSPAQVTRETNDDVGGPLLAIRPVWA
jgi:hypothetical protein